MLAVGCDRSEPATAVAWVGDHPIDQAAVTSRAAQEHLSVEAALEELVSEELLLQAALTAGVHRRPALVQALTEALLAEQVFDPIAKEVPSEEELTAYFSEHPEEFSMPAVVAARWLRIPHDRPEGATLAAHLHQRLVGDLSLFDDLAREHSADETSARRGGSIGVVTADAPGVPAAVLEHAFALGNGGLSPVFETPDGWNLVMVHWRREREERTFEQMRSAVADAVRRQKYVAAKKAYVATLQDAAEVRIDSQALLSIAGDR